MRRSPGRGWLEVGPEEGREGRGWEEGGGGPGQPVPGVTGAQVLVLQGIQDRPHKQPLQTPGRLP